MSCPKCKSPDKSMTSATYQCGSYMTFGGLSRSEACIASVNVSSLPSNNNDLLNSILVANKAIEWCHVNVTDDEIKNRVSDNYNDLMKTYIRSISGIDPKTELNDIRLKLLTAITKKYKYPVIGSDDPMAERIIAKYDELYEKYSKLSDDDIEDSLSEWGMQNMYEGVNPDHDQYSLTCRYIQLERKYKDIL